MPNELEQIIHKLTTTEHALTFDEMVLLAEETRTAQKNYFATRKHEWLVPSKKLERSLDIAIQRHHEHFGTGE